MTPLESLIASGTKLWLDSIDPDLVASSFALGATGATSNPIIVAGLIGSGRFDAQLEALWQRGLSDEQVAWQMTDQLVSDAEQVFRGVWESTGGDDGYVSFEVDPLLESPEADLPHAHRVEQYVALGKQWSEGHPNRLIKVPATPAGIEALEPLAAAGIPLNVTLIFTARQQRAAREAVWRGAQRRADLKQFKSVYSIFVSRVDVYTDQHVPQLSAAVGHVGIVGAKRVWAENCAYWQDKPVPLRQEIVFASTGTKRASDPKDKYVAALAGSDIQTNPPSINDAVQQGGAEYQRRIDVLPPDAVLEEIDTHVAMEPLEATLLAEGVAKFADPQLALLKALTEKRATLAAGN